VLLLCAHHTEQDGFEILWIETISDDEQIVNAHMQQLQDSSPDFLSLEDFRARVEHYKSKYETVAMHEGSYVKMHNAGQRIEIHAAQG
jgi:6-phosphofructo-2-kinase